MSKEFISPPYSFQAIDNPFIKHIRTADPSAHVWLDGKLWLYTSQDQEGQTSYDQMDGYHVFSTSDMVHWVDHGEIFHSRNVSWGVPGCMHAPDCAFKNGKYYLYYPHPISPGCDRTFPRHWKIGVAYSSYPQGPFEDKGAPLSDDESVYDPCVFTDDDGQSYIIAGFGDKIAKLSDDMLSLAEPYRDIKFRENTGYTEGPWLHKRNGIYYYSWTENNCGYCSMGDNPYGPFRNKHLICDQPPNAPDHRSIVIFHNIWYYFNHLGNYAGGSFHCRNISAQTMDYNSDGTIKKVVFTYQGPFSHMLNMHNIR